MATHYFLKLEHFEGPLDLLLHLIRVNELNIFDINLLTLTTQYLEYLRLVRFDDLKDAASFLEMAASLIEIKSYQLLPRDTAKTAGEGDLEGTDDSGLKDLQQRLFEFETFKQAGAYLATQGTTSFKHFTSHEGQRLDLIYGEKCEELIGDPAVLLILYEQMLSTLSERQPAHLSARGEALTIGELMGRIREYLDKLRFYMLQSAYAQMNSRYELIAYILAMLQLARDREIKLYQEADLGPIWLLHKEQNAAETIPAAQGDSPLKETIIG